MGAIRISCAVDGDKIEPLETERVDMAVQAGDDPDRFKNAVGFWVELIDEAGKPVFRQVVADPCARYAEVFAAPGEEGPPIRAVKVDKPSGLFVVVVPDEPGAHHVSLVRSEVDDEQKAVVRREIVRVTVASGEDPAQ